MSNEKINTKKAKKRRGEDLSEYFYSKIFDYLEDWESEYLRNILFGLQFADLPLIVKESGTDTVFKEGDDSIHALIFKLARFNYHKEFPFGYKEEEYNRHYKKMKKRRDDIKTGLLPPPKFRLKESSGLKEMMKYIDNKKFGDQRAKPKVKGKTLILPRHYLLTHGKPKFRDLVNISFLNNFDNVEVPLNYLLKNNYNSYKGDNYDCVSLVKIINDLTNGQGLREYEMANELFERFEIICFNLFMYPLKGQYVETFMKFLIAFQIGHPDIYIKDVSGKGYSVYKKYSFYDDLVNSRIDISVK
ncbi:MAG: hypothetical protein JEZ08_16520 [Clostridiales bacterium]|nr:hypothetical protein [Clostridiales bacterium]